MRTLPGVIIVILLSFFYPNPAIAGYWKHTALQTTVSRSATDSTLRGARQPKPKRVPTYVPRKGIAIALSILGLCPFLSLAFAGSGRGYMGYTDVWGIQWSGSLALLISGLILLAIDWAVGPSYWSILLVAAFCFGVVMYAWQLIDTIRLLHRDLQPKNGKWGQRIKFGD